MSSSYPASSAHPDESYGSPSYPLIMDYTKIVVGGYQLDSWLAQEELDDLLSESPVQI